MMRPFKSSFLLLVASGFLMVGFQNCSDMKVSKKGAESLNAGVPDPNTSQGEQPILHQSSDGTITLTVSSSAAGAQLYYQWLRDGIPIQGQIGPVLQLPSMDEFNSHEYSVIVTGSPRTITANTPAPTTDPAPPTPTTPRGFHLISVQGQGGNWAITKIQAYNRIQNEVIKDCQDAGGGYAAIRECVGELPPYSEEEAAAASECGLSENNDGIFQGIRRCSASHGGVCNGYSHSYTGADSVRIANCLSERGFPVIQKGSVDPLLWYGFYGY